MLLSENIITVMSQQPLKALGPVTKLFPMILAFVGFAALEQQPILLSSTKS